MNGFTSAARLPSTASNTASGALWPSVRRSAVNDSLEGSKRNADGARPPR